MKTSHVERFNLLDEFQWYMVSIIEEEHKHVIIKSRERRFAFVLIPMYTATYLLQLYNSSANFEAQKMTKVIQSGSNTKLSPSSTSFER